MGTMGNAEEHHALNVHSIIEAVASLHPSKPAVCCAGFTSSSALRRPDEDRKAALPPPFDDGAPSPLSCEFISFRELSAMSAAVAAALSARQPRPACGGAPRDETSAATAAPDPPPARDELAEEVVLVLMDEGVGVVASELGVLRAGRAFAPVDPAWPAARIRFIARDCRARRAVVSR